MRPEERLEGLADRVLDALGELAELEGGGEAVRAAMVVLKRIGGAVVHVAEAHLLLVEGPAASRDDPDGGADRLRRVIEAEPGVGVALHLWAVPIEECAAQGPDAGGARSA